MNTLVIWLLAACAFLSPGKDHTLVAESMARVIATERPLFANDEDRTKTAALVTTIAFYEGSLKPSVIGDAHSGSASFCTMQIHTSSGGSAALNEDLDACFRTGIRMLRESMAQCPEYGVAFYARGPKGCTDPHAQRISNHRLYEAKQLRAKVKVAQ